MFLFLSLFFVGLNSLSEYVNHHEVLHYETESIHSEHLRHKRSLPEHEHKVRVDFHSHGRRFQLELERDHSVFHNDLVIKDANENTKHLDTSHIYHGRVLGKKKRGKIPFICYGLLFFSSLFISKKKCY